MCCIVLLYMSIMAQMKQCMIFVSCWLHHLNYTIENFRGSNGVYDTLAITVNLQEMI